MADSKGVKPRIAGNYPGDLCIFDSTDPIISVKFDSIKRVRCSKSARQLHYHCGASSST